jgi:hypothetical protein
LEKETFLEQAAKQNWYLFIEHDEFNQVVTVKGENGRFDVDQVLTLDTI